MAGKTTINEMASAGATEKRARSSIEFPYGDLNDAVDVARAIHENAGTSCSPDQLAGYMNQTITSGAFRLKIATARVFALVETERGGVSLSPLGRRIVDASHEREARVAAFLAVPLYRSVFEKFRGHLLPPPAALEREMASLGVSPKQTSKARQAFERSAEQAGFFAHGSDRLIMPSGTKRPETVPISAASIAPRTGGGSNGGDGGDRPPVDSIILGLIGRLPAADSVWPKADRLKWLQTIAGAFDLVYRSDAEENAEIAITLRVSAEGRG